MSTDQQNQVPQNQQGTQNGQQAASPSEQHAGQGPRDATDGLAHKKPEDLTPEELRLMADTMPGEGPGD